MKATLKKANKIPGTIPMYAMMPGQIGVIEGANYTDEIVMRTLNRDRLEVMSLSKATSERYWNKCFNDGPGPQLPVRLLEKGDKVTLEV